MKVHWANLINLNKPANLCQMCEDELSIIEGFRCLKCSRPTKSEKICFDCERWKSVYQGRDPLIYNHSTYKYNEFIQEVVTQWKYRGDYQLGEIFREKIMLDFKKHYSKIIQNAVIIPLPLSEERLIKRGFNQAEQLTKYLPYEKSLADLRRISSEKQSKMTRVQRIRTKNPFKLTNRLNKRVVLVDDIYTTGMTLRHAAIALREKGCPEVYAYTLIRS